jgi:nicotinamidase-related amidase
MKKVLLLIDVQKYYVSEHHRSLVYINKVIAQYSWRRFPIFNLTYDDPFGSSIVESIKRRLEEAPNVWHFSKDQTNGSKETESVLLLKGLIPGKSKIEVCGFYTNLCVLQTVSSLTKSGHRVAVHGAGTMATSPYAYSSSMKRMKKLGIEIIDESNFVD